MVCNSLGYASIHAFYPNMSKFFQTKFQFSNIDAGHISSIPYLIASFTVPILGSLLSYVGEAYFEILLFSSIGMILMVHLTYLTLRDVTEPGQQGGLFCFLPLFLFGLGHALFTTLQGPTVPKLIKDQNQLPNVLSYIKITESSGITIFTYLAGYIRQISNGYSGVILLLSVCSAISMSASYTLMEENKAAGTHTFNIASLTQ